MQKFIWGLIISVAVVLLGGGYIFYTQVISTPASTQNASNGYATDVVRQGDLVQTLYLEGSLSAAKVEKIYSNESGSVLSTKSLGDKVTKGKRVAVIEVQDGPDSTFKHYPSSSISGVVTAVSVEAGQKVVGEQSVLVEVSTHNNLILEVGVSADEILSLKKNQSVTITIDGIEDPVPGKVTKVVKVPSNDGSYLVRIKLNKTPNKALIGFGAEAEVVIAKVTDVIYVDKLYVQDQANGEKIIYTISAEGELVTNPVVTGFENELYIQILSGVEVGTEIALPNLSLSANNSNNNQQRGGFGAAGLGGGGAVQGARIIAR